MTSETPSVRLSVVIPAWNESGRIATTIEAAAAEFNRRFNAAWELIVVDDGSTDATAGMMTSLSGLVPSLQLIQLAANRGKGAAVRTGVQASVGELILVSDADAATPFGEFEQLERAALQGADVAVGSRVGHIRRSWLRTLPAAAFRSLARMLLRSQVRDTQCGFKLFRGEIGRKLFGRCREDGYLFDLEVLGLAQARGMTVVELPVAWHEVPGSKVRLVRDSWRMFCGLLRIRRRVASDQWSRLADDPDHLPLSRAAASLRSSTASSTRVAALSIAEGSR